MTSRFDRSSTRPEAVIEAVYRSEWGRLLALLVTQTRRFDLAEDALGEAFARAYARWPCDGVPANPSGWLYTTARRLIIGTLRAEAIAGRKVPLIAVRPDWVQPVDSGSTFGDERLQLMLLCCHPALPGESQSALALRLVMGMPTEHIARLFLVSTATMAARLTRAKKKIVLAGIPLVAPLGIELRSRLDEVCRTIYLSFTAGYIPGAGPDLLRTDLANDAVRLASLLLELVPDAPQVRAMLALLVLQHSRRNARVHDGQLVTLANQDRSSWHHDEIRVGLDLLAGLLPDEGYTEELRLQALIAAEHARATTADATNWVTISDLYVTLERRSGSPIMRLNRAVAEAEARGPLAGLALLAGLESALPGNHRVAAVRAELARRMGDRDVAQISYQVAISQCSNEVECSYLNAQLAKIRAAK